MSGPDIACLPRDFLINYAWRTVDDDWNKLPLEMQEDAFIAELQRCTEHNQQGDNGDVYPEGMIFPILKKDCIQCPKH